MNERTRRLLAVATVLAVVVGGCDMLTGAGDGGGSPGGQIPSDAKEITAFGFTSPAAAGTIDEAASTISVTVPFGTDVTALVATFSTTGTSVGVDGTPQVSGTTANDYSSPVTYTVTAADGSSRTYVVTVVVAASDAKEITAFGFTSPAAAGTIDEAASTISVTVPFGTDVTALVATFSTTGTSVSVDDTPQVSGTTANDYSSPVTYTVTAADGSSRTYVVTVSVAPPPLESPALASEDDTGVSSSDGVTNQTTALTLTGGGADGGATVRLVTADDSTVAEVIADSGGEWAFEIDLAEGSYALRAGQRDGDSLIRTSAALALTIDTTPPTAAPTLLSPYVGQNTGADLSPLFRWAGGDGDYIDLQADDNSDYASPEHTWSYLPGTSFEPTTDMTVETSAPVGRRYHFRVRATDAAGNAGAWRVSHYANIGRFHSDFNGDGFSDLVVGEIGFNVDRGRVFVFYGNATADLGGPGITDGADVVINGLDSDDQFGEVATSAGDVNGDGFADLLVTEARGGTTADVYLFPGSATWSAPPASPTDSNSASLRLTGSPPAGFGYAAGGIGDINADGYDDLVVTADLADLANNYGEFFVLFGASTLPTGTADVRTVDDLRTLGTRAGALLGSSVSAAGDLNGDGYADWIVGARREDSDRGAVYVYHGGPTPDATHDLRIVGSPSWHLGANLAHAGDVNGDGFSDIVVGTDGFGGLLYLGGPDMNTGVDGFFTGGHDHASGIGRSVAGVGDVNGDSFDDIAVGAPFLPGLDAGENAGRTILYYGATNPTAGGQTVFDGTGGSTRLGYALGRIGDVDADGRADVFMGTNSATNGEVYGFLGGTIAASVSRGRSDADVAKVNGGTHYGVSVGAPGARSVGLPSEAGSE